MLSICEGSFGLKRPSLEVSGVCIRPGTMEVKVVLHGFFSIQIFKNYIWR